MFAAQWVWCLFEFLFSSMFAGRFPMLPTIFTQLPVVCSWFVSSPSLQEVNGKINFPKMFASVYAALGTCFYKIFFSIPRTFSS